MWSASSGSRGRRRFWRTTFVTFEQKGERDHHARRGRSACSPAFSTATPGICKSTGRLFCRRNSMWMSGPPEGTCGLGGGRSTDGRATAQTSSGSIDLKLVRGAVEARDSGGNIRLEESGGDVFAQTSSGSIHLHRVAGDVEARDSGGDVSIDEAGGAVLAETSSGSIKIKSARGNVVARDSGGDISVEKARSGPLAARTSERVDQAGGECRREGVSLKDSGGNLSVSDTSGDDLEAQTSSEARSESALGVKGKSVLVGIPAATSAWSRLAAAWRPELRAGRSRSDWFMERLRRKTPVATW